MKTRPTLTLAVLALAAGAALADDITPNPPPVPSTRTRAEVHAEVLTARADGTLVTGGEILTMRARPMEAMPLTRAQVRAELKNIDRRSLRNSYQPS